MTTTFLSPAGRDLGRRLRPLLAPRTSLLAALLLLACAPLRAQEPPPTEITSVALEMWSTDTETHAIFTGNVTVTGNQIHLTCDRLEVIATRIGDKTATVATLEKFKYLLATGKVHIVQGEREANCERAEIFPREDKIILTGKPVVIDRAGPTIATGDPLILFRGERRVKGDNVRITLPAIKDLGYDKNQPPPKPDAAPAPTVTLPAPAPTPAKP